MRRLVLLAMLVVSCAAVVSGPDVVSFRREVAFDVNDFYAPVSVYMLEGGGIPYTFLDVDGPSVYFYEQGFHPREWEEMSLQSAVPHCAWAMRNVPNLTNNQVEACAWALMEMRNRELNPAIRVE